MTLPKSNASSDSSLSLVNKESSLTWLTLFTTTGTLVCCALPIILVTFGMGATVASIVATMPFVITLSIHKAWVFTLSGGLLLLSAWMMFKSSRSCPIEPERRKLCQSSQKWNRRIYWFSVVLWFIGFFAAFLALPLQIWFDR